MDWMEANRYSARVTNKYDNWWDWEIGSPIEVGTSCSASARAVGPEEIDKHAAAIDRFVGDPRVMIVNTVSTGANRVWKCKGAILRAIAVRDAARLQLASDALSPVFAYVSAATASTRMAPSSSTRAIPIRAATALPDERLADVLYLLAGSSWEVTDPGARTSGAGWWRASNR